MVTYKYSNKYLDMVCYDLNIVFAAESRRTQSCYFLHLPVVGRQMQIQKHSVLYFKQKIRIRNALKDVINAILPEGLLFFTFWPLSRK